MFWMEEKSYELYNNMQCLFFFFFVNNTIKYNFTRYNKDVQWYERGYFVGISFSTSHALLYESWRQYNS